MCVFKYACVHHVCVMWCVCVCMCVYVCGYVDVHVLVVCMCVHARVWCTYYVWCICVCTQMCVHIDVCCARDPTAQHGYTQPRSSRSHKRRLAKRDTPPCCTAGGWEVPPVPPGCTPRTPPPSQACRCTAPCRTHCATVCLLGSLPSSDRSLPRGRRSFVLGFAGFATGWENINLV